MDGKQTEKVTTGVAVASLLVALGNFVLFMVGPIPWLSLIATAICLGGLYFSGKELGWWG